MNLLVAEQLFVEQNRGRVPLAQQQRHLDVQPVVAERPSPTLERPPDAVLDGVEMHHQLVGRGSVATSVPEEHLQGLPQAGVIGASPARILFKHIFANAMSPVIVYFTLNIASAIISEAALSFLGLGIQPPTASWGSILSEGKSCLQGAPHIATISGMFILVTVLGFNLFGDGIRDVLDPKQKR